MEESGVRGEDSIAAESTVSKDASNNDNPRSDETPRNDDKPANVEPTSNLESLKQINCLVGTNKTPDENEPEPISDKENSSSILKPRDISVGARGKRKSRASRRRLKAMVNNTSLHFSDTDSEGELTQVRSLTPVKSDSTNAHRGPVISVTLDNEKAVLVPSGNPNCLSPDEREIPRSGSFMENLTDVDEIYPSETENEHRENRNSLAITESPHQADTDLEDLEGDEEVQQMIYVQPRSDILCEFSGETVTTKEGDGPFSVEVRNKLSRDYETTTDGDTDTPGILVAPNTDEEDMVLSEDEDTQEACCSQKELPEDLDVLAASQIVMRNVNKMEDTLSLKDTGDDVISDSHTDVEDVE